MPAEQWLNDGLQIIQLMPDHACNCCPSCQQELTSLKSRHQELLADYSNLFRKYQLTQQLESAYQQHQQVSSSTLTQQQQTIQQLQGTIEGQTNHIINLQGQLKQASLILQTAKGRNSASVEDGSFRKEATRCQQLNRTIDSKNRDIMELKQQLTNLPMLQQQYQQLKGERARMAEQLLSTQNALREVDADRQRLRARMDIQERTTEMGVPLRLSKNNWESPSYALESVKMRSNLDSQMMRPILNGSMKLDKNNSIKPIRTNPTFERDSWPDRRTRQEEIDRRARQEEINRRARYEEVDRRLRQEGVGRRVSKAEVDKSQQLWLIKSRIQSLQEENSKLRGELSSVI